jgi:ankyrin repeat protein
MYDEALERIFSQNRDDALLAERVLSWISFAERPLSVTEVQHAIAVLNLGEDETQIDEEGLPDEDLLIAVCAGVVTIDGGNSVIRLIHYTAQQYFERIRDTRFPHAQTEIARACLRYQSLDISINGYCRSRYDLQCRQQEYPLLQYAAQHWGHHASGNSEHVLMGQILAFISNRSCASWSIQTMAHTPWSLFKSIEVPAENGLWLAAGFGLKEIVKVLLQGETDVEDIGPLRETALHIASLQGHTEVVQLLLDHNADVKAINAFGMTALHNAASGGHEKIIRLLLRRGANIHAKDHGRETALYKAAESGRLAVVRLLLGNGADIKVGTPEKFSIIDAAASAGHLLVLQLLLDNDANIFAENKYRVRVLFRAADSNSEEVFHLLEDHCRKNDVPEEILETARKVLNGCEYRVMCDHCEAGILNSNAHYHCSICDHDNFDLCQRCLDDGNICHSESHSLTKRTFSGDEMVEIPS